MRNPFQQEDPRLKNFVTKAVMPEPVKRDTEATDDPKPTTLETNEKAIILDGMTVVHEVSGLQLKTCLEISQAFVRAIDSKSQNYTLVHVDRYDIDKSLKTRTRNRSQGKEGACCKYDFLVYDVTDMTI